MLDAPASTPITEQTPPAIGKEWQGGIYIGHTLHENQLAELVVLPEEFEGNWKNAMAWAEKHDAVLPSRVDALLMFQQRQALKIDSDWYWTAEAHHEDTAYAWCQDFGYGNQGSDPKGHYSRARAVRRIVIR